MKTNPALATLDRAVGTRTVIGSHPYLPGRKLNGRVTFSDGRTMEGKGTMKKEGAAWEPDLSLSYTRVAK